MPRKKRRTKTRRDKQTRQEKATPIRRHTSNDDGLKNENTNGGRVALEWSVVALVATTTLAALIHTGGK
jgi:hypothetical protein